MADGLTTASTTDFDFDFDFDFNWHTTFDANHAIVRL